MSHIKRFTLYGNICLSNKAPFVWKTQWNVWEESHILCLRWNSRHMEGFSLRVSLNCLYNETDLTGSCQRQTQRLQTHCLRNTWKHKWLKIIINLKENSYHYFLILMSFWTPNAVIVSRENERIFKDTVQDLQKQSEHHYFFFQKSKPYDCTISKVFWSHSIDLCKK